MGFRPAWWAGVAAACLWAPATWAADISGELGLVSDYRYRGLSLSESEPALQASLVLEDKSGFHADLWASSIRNQRSGPSAEIDLAAGYEAGLGGGVTLDLALIYYLYPADADGNYVEGLASLSLSRGPGTATLGMALVPPQRATRDQDDRAHGNVYAFGEIAYELADPPVTLTVRAGYERGYFDEVRGGGKWDWQVGAEIVSGMVRLGIEYTGCGPATISNHSLIGSIFLDL